MSIHGISGLGRLAENVSEAEADGFVDVGEESQENDDEVEAGAQFTYIPHNPRKYYRRLLECCLEADLAALRDPTVPDDDQVCSSSIHCSELC